MPRHGFEKQVVLVMKLEKNLVELSIRLLSEAHKMTNKQVLSFNFLKTLNVTLAKRILIELRVNGTRFYFQELFIIFKAGAS